jgi:hypothetical protein
MAPHFGITSSPPYRGSRRVARSGGAHIEGPFAISHCRGPLVFCGPHCRSHDDRLPDALLPGPARILRCTYGGPAIGRLHPGPMAGPPGFFVGSLRRSAYRFSVCLQADARGGFGQRTSASASRPLEGGLPGRTGPGAPRGNPPLAGTPACAPGMDHGRSGATGRILSGIPRGALRHSSRPLVGELNPGRLLDRRPSFRASLREMRGPHARGLAPHPRRSAEDPGGSVVSAASGRRAISFPPYR